MFEDFASSRKGPGLVGILLGTLVLAGFSGLGIAVYSELGVGGEDDNVNDSIAATEASIKSSESSIIELEKKLNTFKGFQTLKPQISSNQAEVTVLTKELANLNAEISGLNEAINSENLAFTSYRQQYRKNERALAVGEMIDLSSVRGEEYKNVKILRVDAAFLQVSSSSGPKGIPFAELPPEVQDRFQFSNDEADALAQVKKKEQIKMNRAIEKFEAQQAVKKGQKDAIKRLERMKSLTAEIAKQQGFAERNRDLSTDSLNQAGKFEGMHRAARAAGKSSMNQGLATQARNKAKLYNNRAIEADKNAAKLQSELNKLSSETL